MLNYDIHKESPLGFEATRDLERVSKLLDETAAALHDAYAVVTQNCDRLLGNEPEVTGKDVPQNAHNGELPRLVAAAEDLRAMAENVRNACSRTSRI